jgi:hypothetical protein
MNLAYRLSCLLHATEGNQRLTTGFIGRHPFRKVLLRLRFDVKCKFAPQIGIVPLTAKQKPHAHKQ